MTHEEDTVARVLGLLWMAVVVFAAVALGMFQ